MRIFVLLILPLATFAAVSYPHPNCYESCDEEAEGALEFKMDCSVEPCVCYVSDGITEVTPCDEDTVPGDGSAILELDGWEDCQKLAEKKGAVDGSPITHFRWQITAGKQYCYLLNKCEHSNGGCTGPAEPDTTCVSGDKICDPAPTPQEYCGQITPFVGTPGFVHWTCGNSEFPDLHFNPYGADGSPPGTICTTDRVCKSWTNPAVLDIPLVEAKCGAGQAWELTASEENQIKNPLDPTTGDTVDSNGDPVDPVVVAPSDGDRECVCAPLPLDGIDAELNKPGTALLCEETLSDDKLVTTNSCVLMCDGHISMIINCFYGEWVNTLGDTLPFPPVTKTDIHC